jgi:ribonuclease P protein component
VARRTQAPAATAGRQPAWGGLESGDFAAMLATSPLAKTPHFVLQHLPARPASALRHGPKPVDQELSTVGAPTRDDSVDNKSTAAHSWLGLVVPKRHAKRAVTRNLLKRQMRVAVDCHRPRLSPGQWLIRLRAPFDARLFPSAASAPLRAAARSELEQLFAAAVAA